MDVQLHTHRHRFSLDDPGFNAREIGDNRDAIASLGIPRDGLKHFCYPSGRYSAAQTGALQAEGIESATTTDWGLNFKGVSPMILRRFTESEAMPPIVFDAALAGVTDVVANPHLLIRRQN